MSSPTALEHPEQASPSMGFNLAGITALVLLLAVGAAYLVDQTSRAARVTLPALGDGNPVSQTIGGQELAIPSSWFRHGQPVEAGFTSQVDLRVMFTPEVGVAAMPVDITLLPRSRVRSSAVLLDTVYLHQFGAETLADVPGLIGKPMSNGRGFEDEMVWYDALSPNPFVAKCAAPVQEGQTAQCVRTVYLSSGIAAVYAFDATALQSWRQFDGEMEKWLRLIGAWQD